MIDWSIVLFFAAGIIIFNLDQVGGHRSLYEYFQFRTELGIQQGTVLLWIAFFTGASLSIPMLLIFHFGLMVSIVLTLCFLIFLYVFIEKNLPPGRTGQKQDLYDFYEKKMTSEGFKLLLPLMVFANLEGLLLQLTLAHIVYRALFPGQSIVFISLLLCFCIIVAGLGGMSVIYRTGYFILAACSFSLMDMPMFRYLNVGIHTIYISYVPSSFDRQEVLLFFGCVLIVAIGKILTDAFLWQILQSIKPKYTASTLKLAIFCFASIPFSVLIFGVYVLSRTHAETFSTFVKNAFQLPGKVMIFMVFCVWISSVIHSVCTSIYAMAVAFTHLLKLKKHDRKNVKRLYGMILVLTVVIVLTQFWLVAYVKVLLISYFLFYLTIALPLWLQARSKQSGSALLPLVLLSLWTFAMIIWLLTNQLLPAGSFVLAGSIIWMTGRWLRYFFKWSKFRKIR